jgi:hypothetical protein
MAKYKLIFGNGRQINEQLEKEAKDGWKPILFDGLEGAPSVTPGHPPGQPMFAIVLEHAG